DRRGEGRDQADDRLVEGTNRRGRQLARVAALPHRSLRRAPHRERQALQPGVEPDHEGRALALDGRGEAVGEGRDHQTSRKFDMSAAPPSVRNDSGWNWTP